MNSLGAILRGTKEVYKASLSELTVLSPQNDPFRLDTPANHIKGQWLQAAMTACGLMKPGKQIHNRGVHYAIVSIGGAVLPNGQPYINDADCWAFLEDASLVARFLGYVEWDRITDARNTEPIVRIVDDESPELHVALPYVDGLPTLADLTPYVAVSEVVVPQPYRLVIYGEKTSLGSVLDPIATRYGADLYLPAGEISNTLLATMARTGANDGREMVVLVFADCDPAGYQMAVSIGHKLRAFQESLYPDLRFRVLTPALTVEQVKQFRLPSTPLKETEKRASGWRERYGVEQTEIDALATLRPDLLEEIATTAIEPFYDRTLGRRARERAEQWRRQAEEEFKRLADGDQIAAIKDRAAEHLVAFKVALSELRQAVDGVEVVVPEFEPPKPILTLEPGPSLITSAMPLVEHIAVLKARKDYSGAAA